MITVAILVHKSNPSNLQPTVFSLHSTQLAPKTIVNKPDTSAAVIHRYPPSHRVVRLIHGSQSQSFTMPENDVPVTPQNDFMIVPEDQQGKTHHNIHINPYTRPLTISDLDSVVALENAAFTDPNERGTREKACSTSISTRDHPSFSVDQSTVHLPAH
jgi:hypothetical protein